MPSNEEEKNPVCLWNWLPIFRQELKILMHSYDGKQEHLPAPKEDVFLLHNPREKFKVDTNLKSCIQTFSSPLSQLKKRVSTRGKYI